jgi:aldose sugar dehydrogenase
MTLRHICAGLLLMAGAASGAAGAPSAPYRVVEVAGGLAHPWSLAFLPDGDLLVSERNGGLRVIHDGKLDPVPVKGIPPTLAKGQGGLLDLALHPDFARNQLVYLCRSTGSVNANASSVIRARWTRAALTEVQTIFTAQPLKKGVVHFGCRLLFGPGGKLFVTLGDGFDYAYQAQALDNHLGKIVRLNDDGSAPEDNPFRKRWKALPEIYTYGHRNVQGIARRPGTDEIWAHEHGPRGGDEVNLLKAGANYGWPMITYGIDYSGQQIAAQPRSPGMEEPQVYWAPSIAPSGMDFYAGDKFPAWRGDLFVGALTGHLRRLDIEDGQILDQEILLQERGERIRFVRNGPDGFLWLLTDAEEGKVLRLEPL